MASKDTINANVPISTITAISLEKGPETPLKPFGPDLEQCPNDGLEWHRARQGGLYRSDNPQGRAGQ